jgi:hypothetical protein
LPKEDLEHIAAAVSFLIICQSVDLTAIEFGKYQLPLTFDVSAARLRLDDY